MIKLKKHIDYWGVAAWTGFWVIMIALQLTATRANTTAQQNVRGIAFSVSILLFAVALVRYISRRKKA